LYVRERKPNDACVYACASLQGFLAKNAVQVYDRKTIHVGHEFVCWCLSRQEFSFTHTHSYTPTTLTTAHIVVEIHKKEIQRRTRKRAGKVCPSWQHVQGMASSIIMQLTLTIVTQCMYVITRKYTHRHTHTHANPCGHRSPHPANVCSSVASSRAV